MGPSGQSPEDPAEEGWLISLGTDSLGAFHVLWVPQSSHSKLQQPSSWSDLGGELIVGPAAQDEDLWFWKGGPFYR